MTETINLEFSSNPFGATDGDLLYRACRDAATQYGFQFGIQLHNTAPESELARCLNLGGTLSVHAPLLAEYNINLAAADPAPGLRELEKTAGLMRRYGIDKAVFHGFRMTDRPTPAFNRILSYDQAMGEDFRPELSVDGVLRLNRDFTSTPEFAERLERVRRNLALIREQYPDLTFYIENDFPAYGTGNLLARDMARLDHPLCLDSSHLWATAYLLHRDYHQEVAAFLATGRVGMVHLHASIYTKDAPLEEWSDGHRPLRTPNVMDLPRLVRACRRAGVRHYVLEIPRGSDADIHDFAAMWKSSEE